MKKKSEKRKMCHQSRVYFLFVYMRLLLVPLPIVTVHNVSDALQIIY